MIIRLLAALGAANFALILPLAAAAQGVPTYAQAGAPPSYAQPGVPSYATQDQQLHGRIASFDGGYNLQVRDDHGYLDNVRLHQGTVINPTGLTLASGMIVSVNGYNQGSFFSANEIDTPYQLYGPVPYYAGHPWYYYGPSISLGFFFGNAGWWHGGYYGNSGYWNHGYSYGRPPLYRGGTWHGRDYVAAPSRGGYVPHGTASRGSSQGGNRTH
jgi:hypothetical protein